MFLSASRRLCAPSCLWNQSPPICTPLQLGARIPNLPHTRTIHGAVPSLSLRPGGLRCGHIDNRGAKTTIAHPGGTGTLAVSALLLHDVSDVRPRSNRFAGKQPYSLVGWALS